MWLVLLTTLMTRLSCWEPSGPLCCCKGATLAWKSASMLSCQSVHTDWSPASPVTMTTRAVAVSTRDTRTMTLTRPLAVAIVEGNGKSWTGVSYASRHMGRAVDSKSGALADQQQLPEANTAAALTTGEKIGRHGHAVQWYCMPCLQHFWHPCTYVTGRLANYIGITCLALLTTHCAGSQYWLQDMAHISFAALSRACLLLLCVTAAQGGSPSMPRNTGTALGPCYCDRQP